MTEYKIYIGMGLDRDGDTINFVVSKQGELKHYLARHFEGYSLGLSEGGWFNSKGDLVTEPTMVVTIIGQEKTSRLFKPLSERVANAASFAKGLFDQETVLVTMTNLVQAIFV